MNIKERKVLLAKEFILKNFMQNFFHEKFPVTPCSHGRVGFHALIPRLKVRVNPMTKSTNRMPV